MTNPGLILNQAAAPAVYISSYVQLPAEITSSMLIYHLVKTIPFNPTVINPQAVEELKINLQAEITGLENSSRDKTEESEQKDEEKEE